MHQGNHRGESMTKFIVGGFGLFFILWAVCLVALCFADVFTVGV